MAHAQTHEPDTPMTREEFLAWVEQQPSGRFKRIDGIVVAMAPEWASHNLRKGAARDCIAARHTRDRATKLRAYFKLPSVRHYLIVWPDEQRIVRHSRMPNDQIATQVFVSGDISLDPPGITLAVEEFYVD